MTVTDATPATQLIAKGGGPSTIALINGANDLTISHKSDVTFGQTDGALPWAAGQALTLKGKSSYLPLYAIAATGLTSEVSIMKEEI